jgi:hypothetical protein
MNWSEACVLTGLEIKKGDTAYILAVSSDHRTETGPANTYAPRTLPLPGLYDGNSDLVINRDGVHNQFLAKMFYAQVERRDNGSSLVDRDVIRSTEGLTLLSEQGLKFLPDLPHNNESMGTLGASLKARVDALRDVLKPFVGDEERQQEADLHAARVVWRNFDFSADPAGMPEYYGQLSLAVQSKANLDWFLECYANSYLLHWGLYEVSKAYARAKQVGPTEGGHKAVGELARFVRRKAIAAGLKA